MQGQIIRRIVTAEFPLQNGNHLLKWMRTCMDTLSRFGLSVKSVTHHQGVILSEDGDIVVRSAPDMVILVYPKAVIKPFNLHSTGEFEAPDKALVHPSVSAMGRAMVRSLESRQHQESPTLCHNRCSTPRCSAQSSGSTCQCQSWQSRTVGKRG